MVVIFYSVTDRSSFAEVERVWSGEALTYCPGVPVVLVASKTDLRDKDEDLVSTDKVASKTDLRNKDGDLVSTDKVASKTDLRGKDGDLVSTDKVASKTDLRSKDGDIFSTEEGKEMAARVCAESFVEISSLKGEGLDNLMSEVVRCAVGHKTRMSLSKKVEKRRNVCCII